MQLIDRFVQLSSSVRAAAGLPQLPLRSEPPLRFEWLRTSTERQAIAELRRLAAFGVEADLGLELREHEAERDRIGTVTGVSRGGRMLATFRFVPVGYGLTAAERLRGDVIRDPGVLGPDSWEVGRVIMGEQDRDPALLQQCLKLTFQHVLRMHRVRCIHASTTIAMSRLWRHFGLTSAASLTGLSGTRYALVSAPIDRVAQALARTQRPPVREVRHAPAWPRPQFHAALA